MAAAFACAERLTGVRLTQGFLDNRNEWIAVGHFPSYSYDGSSWRDALAEAEAERERERQLAPQRALRLLWGDPLPTQRLATVGGNVIGVARLDRELLDDLEAADPETLRGIAIWAARSACSAADVVRFAWVRDGLDAVERGDPLPPPFDDHTRMWDRLTQELGGGPSRAVARVQVGQTSPAVSPASGAPAVSKPHAALPSVPAAAQADPLRAAIDALYAAAIVWRNEYPALFAETRQRLGAPDAT